MILWFRRRDGNKKPFILGTFVGLSPILLLFMKNFIVFGFFGASSWMGMNLAEVTSEILPKAELEMLQQRGYVSPFFPVRFNPDKADMVRADWEKKGRSIVHHQHESLARRKTNNYENYNYLPNFGGDIETLFLNCKIVHGKRVLFMDPRVRKVITLTDVKGGFQKFVGNRKYNDVFEHEYNDIAFY